MVLELLGRPLELIRTVQQFVGQSPWAIEPLIVQLEAVVAETLGDPEGVLTRTCSAVGAGVMRRLGKGLLRVCSALSSARIALAPMSW